MVLPVALRSSRLRPAVVDADAVARADPLHHAVEHRLSVFGLVETKVTKIVEKTAGLRAALGVDSCDISCKRIGISRAVFRFITKPGIPIANGGEADAVHRWVFCRVTEFINIVGNKLRPAGE